MTDLQLRALPAAGELCPPPADPAVLRLPEVLRRTGLSEATVRRRLAAGEFPAPVELGARAIGWPASDIAAWLMSRPRRTARA